MPPQKKTPTTTASRKARISPPNMISVPAGEFWMGTSAAQIQYMLDYEEWADEWYTNDMFQVEQPHHRVYLPAFEISRCPVTNAEYYVFIWETGYRAPRNWIGFHYIEEEANNPVVGVSRDDARAYCGWLKKQLVKMTGEEEHNFEYRLPTEAEWERAARGDEDRIYPWGNDFDLWRCNTADAGKGGTTPAGLYSPSGDSPFGAADMAGNVWEWTNTVLRPYPYKTDDGRDTPDAHEVCIIRGGAWYYSHKLARCSAREGALPSYVSASLGFRLARTI